jgi:phage tail tape-measure protein
MRSPRTAPPEIGLDGSTAATATLWPRGAQGGDIGIDQCRFAGSGRTGKADHRRATDARTDTPINEIRGSAAALHQGDAACQRRRMARCEPVDEIVMRRAGFAALRLLRR